MRYFVYCILISFFATSCKWSNRGLQKELETEEAKRRAYLMGYGLGNQINRSSKEADQKIFLIGLEHGLKGKTSLVNQKALEKTAGKNKHKENQMSEEGKFFLEENKQKPGVKVTSSGLQYKVLKPGTGPSPSATDKVEVHYRGTFIDGKEFDSSYKRNESISFSLNGVIKGWTEGLQLMKEGAEYEFYIPPELGYGPSGTRGIPPNSVLIFKVELIKVL